MSSSLKFVLFVLVTTMASLPSSQASSSDYDFPDYRYHPCVRDCQMDTTPRQCKYTWLIENYSVMSKACWNCPNNLTDCFRPHCVPLNGVKRTVTTANRKIPGPEIQVCLGDTIEVTIDNRMSLHEGTSIHWHGILQRSSPHMDGASMVTQCPIPFGSKFTYSFKAENAGTHFWHAHAGPQKNDGLFGALIVRSPPSVDPSYLLYDHDIPEHVIVLTEWIHKTSLDWIAGLLNYPRTFTFIHLLINGLGPDNSGSQPETPKARFKVKAGQKYRFRVIHSGSFFCPVQLSIDNHPLMIIASDGHPVEPMVVDSFNLQDGERFDFVLYADKTSPLKNYWIRAGGLGGCVVNEMFQTAILEYEGSQDPLPEGNLTYADSFQRGTNLNVYNAQETSTELFITRMQSSSPDDDTMTSIPDRKIYIAMDYKFVNTPFSNHPVLYPMEKVTEENRRMIPQINHISLILPSSPPLSQFEDVPQYLYCNADTVQKACSREYCECVHRYQFEINELVELVMFDEGLPFPVFHPMHLHGFSFRVIGTGKINESVTEEQIRTMDKEGKLQRITTKAPIKDTVAVPDGGYTIIRFRADNPGVWFFHCHREQHVVQGMGVLFQVGNASQMPKAPRDFPRCGSWHFHGYDDEDDDEKDEKDEGGNEVRCVITLNTNKAGEIRFSLYAMSLCLFLFLLVKGVRDVFH